MFTKEELEFLCHVLEKLSFKVGGSSQMVQAESILKKIAEKKKSDKKEKKD